MNYSQTIEYLFNSLPMFQRIGGAAYKANLDNTIKLMDITNNPYRNFKTIHIAGTNGKGSVSHSLASIFQTYGLKTGLYTSPHLKDFRERIKINGKMISQQYVVDFVDKHKIAFDEIKPSFFEMTVALAFDYFSNQKVDIAIIETGMGGRLDSTNVITPLLSVITNIGLDHTQFLGNSLAEIATEKAGIIKNKIPIIIGESNPETDSVFINKANLQNSEIIFSDKLYTAEKLPNSSVFELECSILNGNRKICLTTTLAGNYQLKNMTTLVSVIDLLNKNKIFNISDNCIKNGIKNVIINTDLRGRWQKLNDKPLAICDTGHNTHGIKYVIEQINSINFSKLHFVIGMVNDKDIDTVLSMLPTDAEYYFCKAKIERGMDAELLLKKSAKYNLEGKCYASVEIAYKTALKNAKNDDLVFVGGSTFTVAEVC